MDSLEPTSFRLLIDRVIPVARRHFWAAFPVTAAPVALAGMLMVLMQDRMMSMLIVGDPAGFYFAVGFFFSLFFVLFAYVFAYSALAVAAMATFDDGEMRIGRAWRRILNRKALGTILLWTGAGFLSMLLCAAPTLIVMPLLALTLNVMVAEQRYGMDALKRSAQMVWWTPTGRPIDSPFFRVAALFFIGWGVQWGIGMVVQGPLAAALQYFALRDAAGGVQTDPLAAMGPLWIRVASQFFNSLATTVSWFYWAFGFALFYFELRRVREGRDLHQAILELTEPEAEAPAGDEDGLVTAPHG